MKLHPDAMMFLSTPPSRVATADIVAKDESPKEFLSTPPSRVATEVHLAAQALHPVSIHATLAGGDLCQFGNAVNSISRFYPRHPRGWRPGLGQPVKYSFDVSIHATLAGGDPPSKRNWTTSRAFLSTPPSRVATDTRAVLTSMGIVSIHATLAGGDQLHRRICRHSLTVSIHATLAGGDCS